MGVDVRWHTPPCSTAVHFLLDSHFCLIPSLTLSNHLLLGVPFFLLPFTFIFIAFLPMRYSSHHVLIPHKLPFPHFSKLSLSTYSFISYLVRLHIYTTKGDARVCVCVCKIGPISARTVSIRLQSARTFCSHSNFPIR